MAGKKKIKSHDIEVKTTDIIRTIIDKTDIGLFREMTGRDYGIDAIVEEFNKGEITGKFALIQCKGQLKKIEPLKTNKDYISCSGISESNVDYARQHNSIVILTYASTTDENVFYYGDLYNLITNDIYKKLNKGQKTATVRIPIKNNSKDNMDGFWKIIDDFYKSHANSN